MLLAHLLENFSSTQPITIEGLALDSRLVKSGDLFFAMRGAHIDGRKFIDDAIQRGAAAVLAENENHQIEWRNNVPIISFPHLTHKVGEIAARFFNHPTQDMQIVGITGTNGKTSCSHFIASALMQFAIPCGVIGTLGTGLYGELTASNLTTPDAISLQKLFAEFSARDIKHVAMEASSHSIDQGRINATNFAVGIFTNLTRDHLDYHGTMENYGNAKKKLFERNALKFSVINADDDFGRKLITDLHSNKKIFAYSLEKKSMLPPSVPNIFTDELVLNSSGMYGKINSPWGCGEFSAALIGKFNVSNVLAVFTALCLLEVPFDKAINVLSTLKPVPGRMQTLHAPNKPLVVVDYSHTPDALEKALLALKQHCTGKLFCVFGCGGDRDRGKRPIMAKIAENYADVVMVTNDNPRHENPDQIVNDIMQGFSHPKNIKVEQDRRKAIQEVIKAADKNDCILVAGKGAETYQIIGDEKIPFSDAKVVQEAILGA